MCVTSLLGAQMGAVPVAHKMLHVASSLTCFPDRNDLRIQHTHTSLSFHLSSLPNRAVHSLRLHAALIDSSTPGCRCGSTLAQISNTGVTCSWTARCTLVLIVRVFSFLSPSFLFILSFRTSPCKSSFLMKAQVFRYANESGGASATQIHECVSKRFTSANPAEKKNL